MVDQQQFTEIPDMSQLKLVEFKMNDEIRDNCRQLCSEYLAGPWSDLNPDEIIVEQVEDGLSNRIYVCTNLKLPQCKESTLKSDVPGKVLVRLHGTEFVGDEGDMIVVSKHALPLLSEKLHRVDLAAKIYGVFKEGRVEHFIESEKFPTESWADEKLLDCLTRRLVEIHQLEMPISKDPWSLMQMAERAIALAKENQFLNVALYEPDLQPMIQGMVDFDLKGTAEWIRDMEPFIKSTCVYCHNDLHFGNILNRSTGKSLDDRVFIIDYDNSSYGFRAYDIALFLFMKSFIPGRIETWTNQTIPTPEEKRRIIQVYLDHLKEIRNGHIDTEIDTLEHIERELDWAEVLLQFVCKSIGLLKINPMIARVFALLGQNMEEYDRQVLLAKKRCEQYKQKIINGNHQTVSN